MDATGHTGIIQPQQKGFSMLSRLGLLVGILAVLLPFFVSAQTADTVSKPTEDGWKMAKPIEAGLDPAALADLAALINVDATYPNVHALLIEHRGRLVFERYWPGEDYLLRGGSLGVVDHGPKTLHDIRSISKSVISLLLGIALGETAETRLNHPIASFFPDHQAADPRWEQVTLHHVLSMTAGLAWNELLVPYDQRNDFIRLMKHPDPIGYVLAKEVRDPPGKRWNYNSGLTELVGAVIEHLAGRPLEDYAKEMLFDPLGITDYTWHRPSAWPADAFPSASAGLRMRARDLAKIGSLVLHQGQWQGRQIVPQS